MRKDRRSFIKKGGAAGLGLLSGAGIEIAKAAPFLEIDVQNTMTSSEESVIGPYGPWVNGLYNERLPSLSFRQANYDDVNAWRTKAKAKVRERLGVPDLGDAPEVKVNKTYTYDGLQVEEISWQLPYGRPTEALVLKPLNANDKKLPGILAFHCHSGIKYFGKEKIARTSDKHHEVIEGAYTRYYEDRPWANEIAKKGYVVMIPDAFTFGSRRVLPEEVPDVIRRGLPEHDDRSTEYIDAYNSWASTHEHVMSKSLFCGGTTWPGMFFAEDNIALDILCGRDDVDETNIGCGGLSGGGLRTVMSAGLDERIKCAVCVGFMSTWTDFLLNKSYTHTWMTYAPILPQELDFPEILGLRVPLPTLVLNDSEDQLYTLPEMERARDILEEVYGKAGAKEKFQCSFYPGPHKFDIAMQDEAFAWFDKWLSA
jgi:dienelactone hydrolase